MIRTLFLGTSDFAVPILEQIASMDGFELVGLVTQPDRPVGRKQILTPPDTKLFVGTKLPSVSIYQPEKLKSDGDFILSQTKPDLIIVASYGQFVPKSMLAYPKFGCLNVHGSILPDLRGAVPVPMAILKGYQTTGVSLQIMAEGMDEGDVIAIRECAIDGCETAGSLMSKLAKLSADMIKQDLPRWVNGEIKAVAQDSSKATYCFQKDISKDAALIDFSKHDAIVIERMYRAFYPWPVAWILLGAENRVEEKYFGKKFKVFSCRVLQDLVHDHLRPGEFFKFQKKLCIQTLSGVIELGDVQLEGKARGQSSNYLFLINQK